MEGSDFAPYEVVWNPREERGGSAEREGAGGSWTAVARHFRGSGESSRERAFVRRTSGERELGVQELRVRSPLVKFFFS